MANLREISEFIFTDRIDLAEKKIDQLENKQISKVFESMIATSRGNFNEQYRLCQEVLEFDNVDLLAKVMALDSIAWVHFRRGEYDLGLDFGIMAFEIIRNNQEHIISQYPDIEPKVYNTLGSIYVETGKLKEGLDYYQRSLTIQIQLRNTSGIATAKNNIAFVLQKQGKLKQSLDIYYEALDLYQKLDTGRAIGRVKSNIAEIYRFLTNFTKALEYHKEVLEMRLKSDNTYDQALSYYYVGLTYYEIRNYELAKEYLIKSRDLWRDIGNSQWMSACLFVIGKTFIQLHEDTSVVLSEMKAAVEMEFNDLINQRYILLQSINYLSEQRMLSVAFAQKNLTELLEMESRDFEITYEASVVYTQLLFIELRMTNEISIYEKIKGQINFIENLARENLAYGRIIDILFLKAKLSIAESNYISAEKYLYQAQITAEEHDLKSYLNTIENVQEEIRQDILKFQTIIDQNKNLFDRLELLQVRDYLTMVYRIKEESEQ